MQLWVYFTCISLEPLRQWPCKHRTYSMQAPDEFHASNGRTSKTELQLFFQPRRPSKSWKVRWGTASIDSPQPQQQPIKIAVGTPSIAAYWPESKVGERVPWNLHVFNATMNPQQVEALPCKDTHKKSLYRGQIAESYSNTLNSCSFIPQNPIHTPEGMIWQFIFPTGV